LDNTFLCFQTTFIFLRNRCSKKVQMHLSFQGCLKMLSAKLQMQMHLR
jgi:hypothetical protein